MSIAETEPVCSPDEFLRTLSPSAKQAVFLTLLREALQSHGDCCVLPIDDEEGKSFGYYVPPKVAGDSQRNPPALTKQQRLLTETALQSLHDTFEVPPYLEQLKLADAQRG